MGVNTKIIKRRIKSIGSTKKITKAMEMISAVKMRRAVANVLATRNYATLAWEMLTEIAKTTDVNKHPLLEKRPVKKVGVILITSNRGLAGGFSSRLLQETHKYIMATEAVTSPLTLSSAEARGTTPPLLHKGGDSGAVSHSTVVEVDIILTGRRGHAIYRRFGHTVIAEFDKLDLTTKIDEILPMAQLVVKDYLEKKYDKIVVAYTDFVSAIRQVPRIKQILPIEDKDAFLGQTSHSTQATKATFMNDYGFTFEPDPGQVLNILIPRLVEMQMYQAVLESDASEHSSRMVAMKNATEAAEDMIKELQSSFNKARQAAITQEIAEIVGGAAALG